MIGAGTANVISGDMSKSSIGSCSRADSSVDKSCTTATTITCRTAEAKKLFEWHTSTDDDIACKTSAGEMRFASEQKHVQNLKTHEKEADETHLQFGGAITSHVEPAEIVELPVHAAETPIACTASLPAGNSLPPENEVEKNPSSVLQGVAASGEYLDVFVEKGSRHENPACIATSESDMKSGSSLPPEGESRERLTMMTGVTTPVDSTDIATDKRSRCRDRVSSTTHEMEVKSRCRKHTSRERERSAAVDENLGERKALACGRKPSCLRTTASKEKACVETKARERRTAGIRRLVLTLDAIRRRRNYFSRHAALTSLRVNLTEVRAKEKLAISLVRMQFFSCVFPAWRMAASVERTERQTAIYIAHRLQKQRQWAIAESYCCKRQINRVWLSWRLFIHRAKEERASELVTECAYRFVENLRTEASGRQFHGEAGSDASVPRSTLEAEPVICGISEAVVATTPPKTATVEGTERVDHEPYSQEVSSLPPVTQKPACRSRAPSCSRSSSRCGSKVLPRRIGPSIGAACTAKQPPSQRTEVKRPKLVLDMERRANERRRVQEDRREANRQREEQRIAMEKEADEIRQRQVDDEQRQRLRERREQERAEQLRHAQRQLAVAVQRERMRQAYDFWILHRLVDVWCILRVAALQAAESQLQAFCYYRSSLLRKGFQMWHFQRCRGAVLRNTCRLARARLGCWQSRLWSFRTLVRWLVTMADFVHAEAASARNVVLNGTLRRTTSAWHIIVVEAASEKQIRSLRHYASRLLRYSLIWWKEGCKQTRLEADLEVHKRLLQEKVSGWLREFDQKGPKHLPHKTAVHDLEIYPLDH